MSVLDKINGPSDLKKLNIDELNLLCDEARKFVIQKTNATGGHLGPNLGIVEATVALHYVFNSPQDKFVFDVSHQCYTHKILTGRKEGFTDPSKYLKYCGYTNPNESKHDQFVVGHTSTSVSLCVGLAKARDLHKEKYNVVAIIGDGSLSGGEAYEGLNNAAVLGTGIIIVVNDNEMSIAENQGGLYKNLELLRNTKGTAELNFFKSLGFDYYYEDEGNNVEKLIDIFSKVKDTKVPTVVHIHTLKGKGVKEAETNKEEFHWIIPHALDSDSNSSSSSYKGYEELTADYLLEQNKKYSDLVVITPATPGATGFSKSFRKSLGKDHFVDVAICEEHAMAYSSALAKSGARPVLGILSSFVQRTYDQISQDIGLNRSPVTVLVFWSGVSGADMTHLGSFDIPLISNIPNIHYLAPTSLEEYFDMLDFSLKRQLYPMFIRVPTDNPVVHNPDFISDDYSTVKNKVEIQGEKVAIFGVGSSFSLASKLHQKLKSKFNIQATLINPRFISGLDTNLLEKLKTNHDLIITLENGISDGGYGQKIASYYSHDDIKVYSYGALKEFPDREDSSTLISRYRFSTELIIEDIKSDLN